MCNVIPRAIWIAVFALSWLAAGCGSGSLGAPSSCEGLCDVNAICAAQGAQTSCVCNPGYAGNGYTCVDIDECAAGNPCGDGVCSNVDGAYDCACDAGLVFDGVTCAPPPIAVAGAGTLDSPRTWANGALALSCLDYLLPDPPYVYEGSTGDGFYTLVIDSQPVVVYCDMTTDGGGWTRLLFWARASAPEVHTLASLRAQLIDELAELNDPDITPMGDVSEHADHVRWSDFDFSYDALAYRRDVKVPNNGELLFDVHYYGDRMEKSSIWFYAVSAGVPHDILCWSDAEAAVDYSAAEHALIPYACGTDTSVTNIFWNTVDQPEQRAPGAQITSFHLRSLHSDRDLGDASYLYRLSFYVR